MINSNIPNSVIEARAEDIKQIIIDRNIHGMLWEDLFIKYGILGRVRQQTVMEIVQMSNELINLMETDV